MQQSEEFQLFAKGLYKGESKAPETVFGLLKGGPQATQAGSYLQLLASLYTLASTNKLEDVFTRELARLGAGVLGSAGSPSSGRGYIILLPPFLANQTSFENNFSNLIFETMRPKFQHSMYLVDQSPSESYVPRALKSIYSNHYTFLNQIATTRTAESASWRLLYWGCANGAFQMGTRIVDQKLATEGSLYYILASILAVYKQSVPNIAAFVPKTASNKEINELRLRPIYSRHGAPFKTLYVEPVPISNQVLRAVEKYPQYLRGTVTLDPLNPNKDEIIMNQKCSLGKCEPKGEVYARGLLLRPEEVKLPSMNGSFDDLNCSDYGRYELDDYAKQLSLNLDNQESDTALCQRIKTALKNRFPSS